MNARENILGRIRKATGGVGIAEMEGRLCNHPRGPLPAMTWDPIERFKERALSLSSTVDEVAREQVSAAVARYLASQNLPRSGRFDKLRTGICWPELEGLDWKKQGLSMASRAASNRGDDLVGVTGAFCAIAETGTLMMLSGAETPAATSLLPETHIAVVPLDRIVKCMEEAWDLLRKEQGRLPRAVNFVSGPSRTADIEQTVTLGAHGPYRVHVILVKS